MAEVLLLDNEIGKEKKEWSPEIKDVIMRRTNKKVRHRIIHSQLSDWFANCSTILKVEGVWLHPLNITFFTKCLEVRQKHGKKLKYYETHASRSEISMEKKRTKLRFILHYTNIISSFGMISMSSSWPLSASSNIERLGLTNLFFSSTASCSIS